VRSGKYFNTGVKELDSPHIGHVVSETDDKIVVFGGGDDRYDIPKSEIQQVGGNVLIGLSLYEIVKKYKSSRTFANRYGNTRSMDSAREYRSRYL
jgi:hypothetical protein